MSSTLELAKQHLDAEDRQDVGATLDTFTLDCVYTMDAFKLNWRGKDEIGAHYAGAFAAIPDFHNKAAIWYDAGDDVFLKVLFEGTHNSDWNGIPASGKRFELWTVAHFPRAADGKLAGEHVYINGNDMLYQMGALPSPNAFKIAAHIRKLEAKISELQATLAKGRM